MDKLKIGRFLITPQSLFHFSLYCIALGMPLSRVLVSSGSIFASLAFIWMWLSGGIEPVTRKKWSVIVAVLLCFLVHCIWLVKPGQDYSFALRDLKIKLPLLYFPIVFSLVLIKNQVQVRFFRLFLIACGVSALVTIALAGLHYTGLRSSEFRDFSPFFSHIRLSLNLVIALVLLTTQQVWKGRFSQKLVMALIGLCLLALVVLQSLTGLGILVLLAVLFFSFFWQRTWGKVLATAASLLVLYIAGLGIVYFVQRDAVKDGQRDVTTENGHFVYQEVDDSGMRPAWNAISQVPFDSSNGSGFVLHGALVRYLTSKNLPKSASGIQKLSAQDITAIEGGQTNVKQSDWWPLRSRIEALRYQLEVLASGRSPNSNSVGMRWAYWELAANIWQENFWLGTGIQNLKAAYTAAFDHYRFEIDLVFQKRAHNQWLTFLAAFGIIGGVVCIFSWVAPVFMQRKTLSYAGLMVVVSIWTSFFFEDTLETQMGATFAAFWFAWFVLGKREETSEN